MRGNRRARSLHFAGLIPHLIYIFTCLKLSGSSEYGGIPIEIKLWDTGRTPLSHMVDVTNEFGLKVLAEHNFLNDNNIAFSPYGLMGIMVALYEGVDGEASYQIQRALQLPWNRNVMRIGFRDIHRTLKTYFVPEEGFLAGLALNNENVTFNEQYKKILRFYGFDLENDQLPTLSPENNNSTNATTLSTSTMNSMSPGDTTTTTTSLLTENTPAREDPTTPTTKEETTPISMSTINPNAETIATVDIRDVTSTTMSPSSAPNAEDTSVSSSLTATEQATSERISETTTQIPTSPETQLTTVLSTTSTIDSTTPMIDTTSTTFTSSTTTDALTTNAVPLTTASVAPTPTSSPSTTTVDPTTTTIISTVITVTPDMTTESPAQSDTETFSQTSQVTSALTDGATGNNEVVTSAAEMSTVQTPTQEMTTESSSTFETSTISFTTVPENAQTESVMASTSETQQTEQVSTTNMDDMTTVSNSVTPINQSTLETLERRKRSIVDFIFTNPPYINDYVYYRSFDIGSETPNPNPDKMFMANGLKSVQVTYMRYDTVLEFAYLPHLEASALRLPLDSDRYYLLVILPTRGGAAELGRLLARMARESDLSDVYSVLRPRRVRGIVPSFIVKGHVTLTTDLQKLGVRDVFEPRQRDFTPMTQQAGVYVRSIEQAVSVAIRKYRPDDQKKNRYVTSREPVVFSATYPFLYFVMDANIHVALMAGKMVDPLNSRIL